MHKDRFRGLVVRASAWRDGGREFELLSRYHKDVNISTSWSLGIPCWASSVITVQLALSLRTGCCTVGFHWQVHSQSKNVYAIPHLTKNSICFICAELPYRGTQDVCLLDLYPIKRCSTVKVDHGLQCPTASFFKRAFDNFLVLLLPSPCFADIPYAWKGFTLLTWEQ